MDNPFDFTPSDETEAEVLAKARAARDERKNPPPPPLGQRVRDGVDAFVGVCILIVSLVLGFGVAALVGYSCLRGSDLGDGFFQVVLMILVATGIPLVITALSLKVLTKLCHRLGLVRDASFVRTR
jgi:hypothetical protein